jgi:hypothetical protein
MTSRPPLRRLWLPLALALFLAPSFAGRASADVLPRLEADSMGGTHVVLPHDAGGKPFVLLLAFTKESKNDLRSWSRKLLDDKIDANAEIYVVVVADKTMFVSRRHVRDMVEGAAVGTQAQINSNVLLTFDGTGWRDLVPPGDKKTAGVVVCDSNGSIVYAKREPFTNGNLADVEKAVKS